MIWQRLEESYGSPEMIENALMRRLKNFTCMISNKDPHQLRE
jgi:hypothetical protein